jgi:peptide-methionine (S)-S-oxide reductase
MRSVSYLGLGGVLAVTMVAASSAVGASAETFVNAPQPRITAPATGKTETAIFAGGCFWGVEGVFDHVKGVVSATSGYAGGTTGSPSYEQVSTGTTGHAEAVRVVFDPAKVSYAELLRIYFSVVADPTTLNAQGPDHGSQYRTALFPQSAGQSGLRAPTFNSSRRHTPSPARSSRGLSIRAASIRLRAIIRTSWRRTRLIRTSSSTMRPRSTRCAA